MSRIQLALNVPDIDEAVTFYSRLFDTEPNKIRSNYANFAIEDPPLKLVLIKTDDALSPLNHLGVEVVSSDEVMRARKRLSESGLVTAVEDSVECCYALQDKVWVSAPDGESWEIYTVLADVDTQVRPEGDSPDNFACCSSPDQAGLATSKCC